MRDNGHHNTDRFSEINDMVSEYERMEDLEKREKEQKRRKHEKRKKFFFAVKVFAFTSLAVLGTSLIVLLVRERGFFSSDAHWVDGIVRESDIKIKGCIANLWDIREAIDGFYRENGRYPESLEEIYKGNMLKKEMLCPGGGNKYITETVAGEARISCPEPGIHGVSKLWIDIRTGPPKVRRWDP